MNDLSLLGGHLAVISGPLVNFALDEVGLRAAKGGSALVYIDHLDTCLGEGRAGAGAPDEQIANEEERMRVTVVRELLMGSSKAKRHVPCG